MFCLWNFTNASLEVFTSLPVEKRTTIWSFECGHQQLPLQLYAYFGTPEAQIEEGNLLGRWCWRGRKSIRMIHALSRTYKDIRFFDDLIPHKMNADKLQTIMEGRWLHRTEKGRNSSTAFPSTSRFAWYCTTPTLRLLPKITFLRHPIFVGSQEACVWTIIMSNWEKLFCANYHQCSC